MSGADDQSGQGKQDVGPRLATRAAIAELLPEYALGMLGAAETRAVEAAVAADASLAAELAAWRETASQLALALPPLPVTERSWADLEARLAARPGRFAAFVARVARALEVGEDVARRLLDGIDVAASWVAGPSPSSRLYHVEPGPGILAVGGIAGFVKVDPGARFPRHKHLGAEHVLVLQGGFTDDDGRDYVAGDDSHLGAGTAHDFVAHAGEPLVYLAVIRGQIDFGDGFEL
jgi:putative transcriptional regulator